MGNTAHGPGMDRWTPQGAGADFTLSPIMASLEPFKGYVTSIGNLENRAMVGGVHSLAPATWLSGVRPDDNVAGASMATTLDQVVAARISADTTLPSLEVASETTIQVAACGGARCYYSSTVSFRDPYSPLPMEFNPRKVFTQLFGEGDTPEERDAISRQTASLLDRIRDQTRTFERDLDPGDRAILGGYMDTVREIERRIEMAASRDISGIEIPEAPIGALDSFDEQVGILFDLIALAYQADLTRVASYIMVAEGTNRTYNHIGISDSFHPVSHHANDLGRIEKLVRIQTWHMERFADFIGKLAATPDGDGSLLDQSIFLYGSNMSNSDRHNGHPLPTIVVGGGGGTFGGGRHIEPPDPTPLANVHLTLLGKAGLEQESFGDSTGTITDL
jgi:hypothetical protein